MVIDTASVVLLMSNASEVMVPVADVEPNLIPL